MAKGWWFTELNLAVVALLDSNGIKGVAHRLLCMMVTDCQPLMIKDVPSGLVRAKLQMFVLEDHWETFPSKINKREMKKDPRGQTCCSNVRVLFSLRRNPLESTCTGSPAPL